MNWTKRWVNNVMCIELPVAESIITTRSRVREGDVFSHVCLSIQGESSCAQTRTCSNLFTLGPPGLPTREPLEPVQTCSLCSPYKLAVALRLKGLLVYQCSTHKSLNTHTRTHTHNQVQSPVPWYIIPVPLYWANHRHIDIVLCAITAESGSVLGCNWIGLWE